MADSNKTTVVRQGGISFMGALTILFIALKLTGHIEWSWLWVLSPLWGPIALIFSIAIVLFVFVLIMQTGASVVEKVTDKHR